MHAGGSSHGLLNCDRCWPPCPAAGTCARPVTGDRAAFFNATMRLHEQLDLDVSGCLVSKGCRAPHVHLAASLTNTGMLRQRSAAPACFYLQVALATAGILPSDSDLYVTRKVARAVEDAWGVAPLLECWHGQLLEVRLCVGLDLKVCGPVGWLDA